MAIDIYKSIYQEFAKSEEPHSLPSEHLAQLALEAIRVESAFVNTSSLLYNTAGALCSLADESLVVLADELDGDDISGTLDVSMTKPSCIRVAKGGSHSVIKELVMTVKFITFSEEEFTDLVYIYNIDFADLSLVNNGTIPAGSGNATAQSRPSGKDKYPITHLVKIDKSYEYEVFFKYFCKETERELSDMDKTLKQVFGSEWFACEVAKFLKCYGFDPSCVRELKRNFLKGFHRKAVAKNKARKEIESRK